MKFTFWQVGCRDRAPALHAREEYALRGRSCGDPDSTIWSWGYTASKPLVSSRLSYHITFNKSPSIYTTLDWTLMFALRTLIDKRRHQQKVGSTQRRMLTLLGRNQERWVERELLIVRCQHMKMGFTLFSFV